MYNDFRPQYGVAIVNRAYYSSNYINKLHIGNIVILFKQ